MKLTVVIVYLLAIIVMAVFPFSAVGVGSFNELQVITFRLDHLLHLAVFIPFYPLVVWLLNPSGTTQKAFILLAALGFAALTEYMQLYIDYRSYNPADLIANIAGIIAGFSGSILYVWLFRRSK